jgi:hypothetical protein
MARACGAQEDALAAAMAEAGRHASAARDAYSAFASSGLPDGGDQPGARPAQLRRCSENGNRINGLRVSAGSYAQICAQFLLITSVRHTTHE